MRRIGPMGDRAHIDMNLIPLAFIGGYEWVPIILVLLLLFGGRKLPELARAMGSSITQFKKGIKDEEPDDTKKIDGGDPPKGD